MAALDGRNIGSRFTVSSFIFLFAGTEKSGSDEAILHREKLHVAGVWHSDPPHTHFDPCSLTPLISEQYIQGSLISILHFLVCAHV